MRIFGGRSLAFSCFSFIAFLFVSKYLRLEVRRGIIIPIIAMAVVLFTVSMILLFLSKQELSGRIFVPVFALLSAAAALVLCFITVDRDIAISREYSGKTVSLSVEVTEEISEYPYYSAYLGNAVAIDGQKSDIGVRIELEYDGELSRGDIIEGDFLLSLPAEELYGYPLRDSYISDGIYLIVSAETFQRVGRTDKDIFDYIKDMGEYLVSLTEEIFRGDDGGLNSALIFGDKSGLSDSLQRDIRRLGLSHLLALSGMHLSIIVGGLEKLFKRTTIPRFISSAVMIPATLLYCAITGFSLSVMRAGIMLIIFHIAVLVGREYDSLTALFLSASIICAISPGAVWDAGLLLSFFTMLSIIVISNPLNTIIHRIGFIKRIPKKIRFPLVSALFIFTCGFFAVIFAMPVMWLYFSEISFMGIFLTAVISPLVTAVIVLGIFALIFSFVPHLSAIIAAADIFICGIVRDICGYFSDMRNISFSLGYPGVGVILMLFFVLMIICVLFIRRRLLFTSAVSIISMLSVIICIAVNYQLDSSLSRVVYLYEGKNETVTVISCGKAMICDMSSGGYNVTRKTIDAIENECLTEVECYVLTHYHVRHVSSFDKLSDNEKVRSLLLPEPADDAEKKIYTDLTAIAEEKGCRVTVYSDVTDTPLIFGETELIIRGGELSRSTHPTFSLAIRCGEGEGLAYLSSSFRESNPSYTRDIKNGNYFVIRGLHGPIATEDVKMDFINTEEVDIYRHVFGKVTDGEG